MWWRAGKEKRKSLFQDFRFFCLFSKDKPIVTGNKFTYIVMETAYILKAVTKVAIGDHERHVISQELVICKFLLVNPATSATSEMAFSMARRVIWLGANIMRQHEG